MRWLTKSKLLEFKHGPSRNSFDFFSLLKFKHGPLSVMKIHRETSRVLNTLQMKNDFEEHDDVVDDFIAMQNDCLVLKAVLCLKTKTQLRPTANKA